MLPVASIRDVPLPDLKRIFDINYFSVVDLVQRSLPHLSPMSPSSASSEVTTQTQTQKPKPTIIIVTSGVDSTVLYRGWSGYCTSKAALSRFIHLLAHEEGPDINVYGVLPLVTKSPMVDKIFDGEYDHVMHPEERERFNTWAKEGRIEPPQYIANAIVKAAVGEITPESEEVERNECGALFIGSLYQK
jgi:NAD(P)-dependent dehydrogenase (short-subunit alcohol dehydrogenase family)